MSCMTAHDFATFCGTSSSKNDLDPWYVPLKNSGNCPKEICRKSTSKQTSMTVTNIFDLHIGVKRTKNRSVTSKR